jgi:two-component system sensor histidine kinase KdpD
MTGQPATWLGETNFTIPDQLGGLTSNTRANETTGSHGVGPLTPYVVTLGAVVVAVAAVALVGTQVEDSAVAMFLYLVPVVLAASQWGLGPAITAVAASLVLHDYLLVEPLFAFSVHHSDEALAMFLLVFTALVTAHLANRARRSATAIREATIVRRSDEFKTALLRSVTHDLRTPLTSIKGSVSVLRQPEAYVTDSEHRELLATIESQTDRLSRLVANLLDASRLAGGRVEPRLQPQNLAEIVARALSHVRFELRGHHVIVDLPPHLEHVACDEIHIEQVLFNLLDNAARYTPPGTTLRIVGKRVGIMVEVEVSDDGPGIRIDDRARVFAPFERGSTAADGTGLGLSIARGFIEAHGGRIWLDDSRQRGASFVFTVPVWSAS